MGKWICNDCGEPCTFDSGRRNMSKDYIGKMALLCAHHPHWREVKEEPEKTPAGVVTWTNVPPSGCVSIPYMAFECPECKEKDERIDELTSDVKTWKDVSNGRAGKIRRLLESHRDFIDMHNATKREKDAEIERMQAESADWEETAGRMSDRASRLGGEVEDRDAEIGRLQERLPHVGARVAISNLERNIALDKEHIIDLESDLSSERHDNARLRNEADARGVEIESLKHSGPTVDGFAGKLDSIIDLLEEREECDDGIDEFNARVDADNADTGDTIRRTAKKIESILELLQGWEPDTTSK